MPMTHAPETGTENPYQKTRTSFQHGVEHCSTPYQILVPEKIDTDSYDTPAENWYRFSGTGFRYRFLVRVSLA